VIFKTGDNFLVIFRTGDNFLVIFRTGDNFLVIFRTSDNFLGIFRTGDIFWRFLGPLLGKRNVSQLGNTRRATNNITRPYIRTHGG